MSNFGFTELHLVRPYEVAFREAVSAVKSTYILERAVVHSSLADALEGCTLVVGTTSVGHRDLHVPLYRLETAGANLREAAKQSQVALLFGSEKFGLSNEEMSYCHWLTRIPSREEHGSMNLGQAVAICLYEMIRSDSAPETLFPSAERIDGAVGSRITDLLFEALSRAGYVQPRTADSTLLKLRRLVLRLGMPATDAETWTGFLRHIVWKLKQGTAAAQGDVGGGSLSAPEMLEQRPASDSQ